MHLVAVTKEHMFTERLSCV